MKFGTTKQDRPPVDRDQREAMLGQRGHVLWFTGLSGAGKTTLAQEVERRLLDRKVLTARLDGDVVRDGLNSDLGFKPEDRAENIRRMTEVANIFTLSGVCALVSAISPYRADRKAARERIGDRFLLMHVATPLEVCEARDPKGLYKKARAGEIKDFTGISAPYEEPRNPDMKIVTEGKTIDESANEIMEFLEQRGVIGDR